LISAKTVNILQELSSCWDWRPCRRKVGLFP